MRTLAVGDIHGCLRAFDLLLEQLDPQRGDLVVTLGDYVDRGTGSKDVLDRLVGLRARTQLVAIQGNHDLMMLAAQGRGSLRGVALLWRQANARILWRDVQLANVREAIPARHWRFLEDDCVAYHESDAHFFVHASVHPDLPLPEQPDYMLYWEMLEASTCGPHESGKTMVCGHSVQRSGRPLVLDHAICIDTWVRSRTGAKGIAPSEEIRRRRNPAATGRIAFRAEQNDRPGIMPAGGCRHAAPRSFSPTR